MIIDINKFIEAISRATDFVEAEMLNIPPFHEKRVAVLAARMAEYMGMEQDTVYALTMAGALHDCALSEYLKDEFSENGVVTEEFDMSAHCLTGEKMLKNFPFYDRVKGAVLYHHDRADGTGALGMRADETPIYAQLIHIADMADVQFQLYSMDPEKHQTLMAWINSQSGKMFSEECCRVFTAVADYPLLDSISGEKCIEALDQLLPSKMIDVPIPVLRELAVFLAHTTDYKSHFTWRHSLGIAEKAELLGKFYGYEKEHCDELFIAGALHDIGKLLIPNDILEKPGKLTSEEYRTVQNHAMGTWVLLNPIGGMEKISRWAALHHEKLDGSGYPFGLRAEDLGKEERMMACLDIYQALVEERPYKPGLSHTKAMEILWKMGHAGQLDLQILKDIEDCYAEYHTCEDKPEEKKSVKQVFSGEAWRCPVCGYIYEGRLPADFICPQCEQAGSVFELLN